MPGSVGGAELAAVMEYRRRPDTGRTMLKFCRRWRYPEPLVREIRTYG